MSMVTKVLPITLLYYYYNNRYTYMIPNLHDRYVMKVRYNQVSLRTFKNVHQIVHFPHTNAR